MIIPIEWKVMRKSFFPIIDVYGYTKVKDSYTEKILLKNSVDIINKAQEFEGRAMEISDKDINECRSFGSRDSNLIVGFKIIFKDEEGITKFQNYLKNSGGAFL